MSNPMQDAAIVLYRGKERGLTSLQWLSSQHTFSFGDYFSRERQGFRSLRVINEDRVLPGAGFGLHGHSNMEILSLVLDGELVHRDSMGNHRALKANHVQYISSGTGIRHSELNESATEPVHFLQIWIEPNQRNTTPRYQELVLSNDNATATLHVIAAPSDDGQWISIQQDAIVAVGSIHASQNLEYSVATGRAVFLQLITGDLSVEDIRLVEGDAISIEHLTNVSISANSDSRFLLFDLG